MNFKNICMGGSVSLLETPCPLDDILYLVDLDTLEIIDLSVIEALDYVSKTINLMKVNDSLYGTSESLGLSRNMRFSNIIYKVRGLKGSSIRINGVNNAFTYLNDDGGGYDIFCNGEYLCNLMFYYNSDGLYIRLMYITIEDSCYVAVISILPRSDSFQRIFVIKVYFDMQGYPVRVIPFDPNSTNFSCYYKFIPKNKVLAGKLALLGSINILY